MWSHVVMTNCTPFVTWTNLRLFYLYTAKHHPSQKRPRTRTLTNVHKEILTDVCFPSNITGRGVRIDIDGKKSQKVCLDPLDKEIMEDKLSAITHCYHKLTTHKIHLGFSKPTLFQQKTLEQRERAKAKWSECIKIFWSKLSLSIGDYREQLIARQIKIIIK